MSRTIEQKKKDVLNAATKLFAENGFEATTMSDIAKLSNVGFGSVASYYENKETLLYKCVEEPMQDLLEKTLQFDCNTQNFRNEIEAMTYQHFKVFHENRTYLLLLIHVTSQWERYFKPYELAHEFAVTIAKKIELLIKNGQNVGQISAGDAWIISNAYISFILGLFISNTNEFAEETLKSFAETSNRLFGLL